MAVDPSKKKPKGEPVAGEQQANNYRFSDDQIRASIQRWDTGFVSKRNGEFVKRSLNQQYDEAVADSKRYGMQPYYEQQIRLLKEMGAGPQKEKEAGSSDSAARPQQKKKTASLTGNQGIIGSMLNLGGNKLLGGN